jgi:hypothetical protein
MQPCMPGVYVQAVAPAAVSQGTVVPSSIHCCVAALSTNHQRPVLACRVMLHASYAFRINSVGIEFDSVKVQKAESMVQHAMMEVAKGRWPLLLQAHDHFHAPVIKTADIEEVCAGCHGDGDMAWHVHVHVFDSMP